MKDGYKNWLREKGYQDNTVTAQLHRVGKVEQFYGGLDEIIAGGGYEALIAELTYSTADERAGRPNPSRIPVEGNIRNGLQSYRNAVSWYRRFLQEGDDAAGGEAAPLPVAGERPRLAENGQDAQKISLERDMQAALRRNIETLESGLTIIDDGMERGVLSGYIDILCRDAQGRLTVIELKAGKTDARVIGQILGYMGDLAEEEPSETVRGVIVALDFDQRTKSAARAVPALSLYRYAVSFLFEREI